MMLPSSKEVEYAQTLPPSRRVFVGLRIAPAIATELTKFAAALEKLPVRLVKPADIHLTLVPPWNEASIPDAIGKLGRVAGRFDDFRLIFRHVGYGPQPRRPRLLWADCAATDQIVEVRAALLQAFGQADERAFQPHVTLARFRANGAAIVRQHPIDRAVSLTQCVESLELFQSPPPGASGYQVLASLRLGKAGGAAPAP